MRFPIRLGFHGLNIYLKIKLRKPTPLFWTAFVSADRAILWHGLSLKFVGGKFISLIQSVHSNSGGRVRVYGGLSFTFVTRTGVCQSSSFHLLLSSLSLWCLLYPHVKTLSSLFSWFRTRGERCAAEWEFTQDVCLFPDKMTVFTCKVLLPD